MSRSSGRSATATALAAVVPVLLGVSACAGPAAQGTSHTSSAQGTSHASSAQVAADLTATCVASAHPAPAPYGERFPQRWPFPPKTVVFHVDDRGAGGTVVTAVSAAGLDEVKQFMNRTVAAAGFEVERGESEARDAEAEWRGSGFRGRWAIRQSPSCPGETLIQVLSTTT